MELETIRAPMDWLAGVTNPTYGVNAMIATTPLDGNDPAPAPFVTFADSTRDQWVARKHWAREGGPALPALAAFLEPPFTLPGEVGTIVRDSHPTLVLIALDENADSMELRRDALYRRRTILRSLTQFNHPLNAGVRARNGISLLVCESIEGGQTSEPFGDAFALDVLKVQFLVRDHAP